MYADHRLVVEGEKVVGFNGMQTDKEWYFLENAINGGYYIVNKLANCQLFYDNTSDKFGCIVGPK